MKNVLFKSAFDFTYQDMMNYLDTLKDNPLKVIALIVDITIVLLLIIKLIKVVRKTRAWQLIKGIAFLVIITILSSVLELHILNNILTSFMTYGVIFLIIIFQPELRRALEQLRYKQIYQIFWNR